MTDGFFRSRLDGIIDAPHPLAFLGVLFGCVQHQVVY